MKTKHVKDDNGCEASGINENTVVVLTTTHSCIQGQSQGRGTSLKNCARAKMALRARLGESQDALEGRSDWGGQRSPQGQVIKRKQ